MIPIIDRHLAFEPSEVWFTSDTHFCHENIIRFSGRPFANAAEMNEELIQRWNETVPEDGVVFHLGDFCMGGSKAWNDILYRLKGKIYLILGNHDMKNIKQGFMQRFELVTQQMTIRVGGQAIILNHNPFLCYGGSYRDVWQLFGHVHSGPHSKTGLDLPRLKMLFPLQYDVGVDNNDFRPVSFAEVKARIEAQVEAAREASGLSDMRARAETAASFSWSRPLRRRVACKRRRSSACWPLRAMSWKSPYARASR